MDLVKKTEILSAAARYDASCASSGSNRSSSSGMGMTSTSGICHSWAADGRCISLLKILYTNYCIYDCAYCINRCSNDIPRTSFTVREVVDLTLNFYKRNYIEGLFLSSGVIRNPDYTMEQITLIAETLRRERFGGYIHLKAIPGTSQELLQRAGFAADRLSVNIELPSEQSLQRLAPQKSRHSIMKPMSYIGSHWRHSKTERRKNKKAPRFSPSGQSTQLIIGASPETDKHILYLAEQMYKSYALKRVYYSAYVPIADDARLPSPFSDAPLAREHRLYQADWLVRCYGFDAHELLSDQQPTLDTEVDPKASWALQNLHHFPKEINKADYEELLRVPGIGFVSARRIVQTRTIKRITEDQLPKLGVIMKRARFFITLNGRLPTGTRINPSTIRQQLMPAIRSQSKTNAQQLTLF